MNDFEKKWVSIADSGHSAGRYRVCPDHLLDFHVQYSVAGLRELVIELIANGIPDFQLPVFRNIDVVKVDCAGGIRIGFTLQNSDLSRSFSVMCWDLAERSRVGADALDAACVLIKALDNWAELFRALPEGGLTREEVLGLIGELLVLEKLIDEGTSAAVLVHGWGGPDREARDIGINGTRIEVKAQRSTAATRLHISSLHQLDDRGDRVYVVLFRLTPSEKGRSLVDIVDNLRARLVSFPAAQMDFEKKMSQIGMSWGSPYERETWAVDQRLVYNVGNEFPRLVPACVPVGIMAVRYEVGGPALDACASSWKHLSERIHG